MSKENDKSTLRKPGEYLPEEDPSLLTAKLAASWRKSDRNKEQDKKNWRTSFRAIWARFLLWLSEGV